MSSSAKPGRRAFVKWGLASAGVPLVSDALGTLADGKAEPLDNGERGGSTVSVGSGIPMYYKEIGWARHGLTANRLSIARQS
jgi:hypothetical protein